MDLINKLYGRFPEIEVASRRIYCRVKGNETIKHSRLLKTLKSNILGRNAKDTSERSWDNYSSYIRSLGISNGDILIVHSSMDGLKRMNVQKEEIISFLRELIGPMGTLAMPAYPFYKGKNIEVKFDEEGEETKVYKLRSSSWTGILPNYLCTLEGARRSFFPLDPLAAVGKEADAMMKDNLRGQTSHGRYTAWDYCNSRHAKVLFMGVEPFHCNSGGHIFEDLHEEMWPVKGWYKEQKFIIKNGDQTIEFSCKLRKRFWNQYLAEIYGTKQLIKNDILQFARIEDIPLGFIRDLSNMTDFVADSVVRRKDLLSWRVPRRYWK